MNSIWRLKKGTTEASTPDITAWRAAGFNDAGFADAAAPFWYGDIRTGGTELGDMLNGYTCVFLRKTFTVSDLSQIGGLRLSYFIDDGFVVWLNGVELYRENVTDANPTVATLAANQPTDPAPTTSVNIVPPAGALLNGANVLAVQFFNTSIGSSDIGFDLAVDTIVAETTPPTIVSKLPAPGTVTALTGITVTFSEPVTGVDAGDMLLNGIPVDGVAGSGTTYAFTFAQPPYGSVFITWSSGNGIADEATPPNPFNPAGPGATWQYTLIDQTPPIATLIFPAPGSTLRALSQIEVTFSEEVAGVDAADLRINGQPATSVSRNPGGPYVFQFPAAGAGNAQIQWAAGHGIADQAVPSNAFAGGSWSYTIDPNLATADLVINEILASNQNGLADEDGQPQDWIEIYNRGTTTVDLTGWSLSDDPELPGLWTFGSRALGPGQYLLVFASGKDRKNPAGANRLHSNFQLSGGGEFLGLYNADSPRVLVSSLGAEYPEQRNDFSYGYDPQRNLRYFSTPTPGAANGSSTIASLCEAVDFSMSRGFFTQPFDVVLSTATPGATIRYTLDGSEPTANTGLPYVAPLRVTNTTYLRAAAFRANTLPSTIRTHSYLFNQSAAIRSLPVLSIVTAVSNLYGRTGILGMNGGSRSGDGAFIIVNPTTDYHNPSQHGIAWERPVSAELINSADNSGFQIDCGIRVQGSDWQRPRTLPNTKFSYRLYFRGDYGSGRLEYPVFPLTSVQNFDQLVLRAGYNENNNPFVRDELSRRLFTDMGNVGSLGRFYNLFTNGVYAGFYNPCERVHEEFGQAHHGGSSDWDIIAPSFATSSEGLGIVDGDRNDFNSLHNYINGQTPTTITNPAVYREIARRLDLRNFVDYCLINAHAAMGDWPPNNWRAGKDRSPGGIWRFYVWDAEWGFGYAGRGFTRDSFAESGGGPGDSGLNSTGGSEIARMYQRMRPSREFRLLWADRIYKHYFNNGALSDLHITNRLIEMRNEFSTIFTMNMGELSPFLANRRGVMMNLLNNYGLFGVSNSLYGFYASSNAPVFNQHGGKVAPGFALSMSSPLGGTIYYTTNGSDPRVPFSGSVSNAALAYASPVILNQSLPIKARTLLNGTNWSALADVTFEVGTLGVPIRITEVMYNPPGGSVHEFVELQNFGGNTIDLSEFTFTEGITFTFLSGTTITPGARLVLANGTDPAAFTTRYPGVPVTGYFSGNLNNGGERVTLVDRTGSIVASVDFRDTGGWPATADGFGASLELVDLFGDPDDPANWRASQTTGGTPGTANAVPPVSAIQLSEVLAVNTGAVNNGGTFPGYVELYNPGLTAFSVANWSLT
ncbi:MAG TPA: lamin tail domain-containing protein, partial [Verrucomicrobiae bacterium]|nr:lamin tail domain-containing protein [Verrucomicrobiae bacterium]